MVFIEHDAKLLLQRLPEGVKKEHYHDGETHIRQLLEKYDLMPKRGASLAAATVRGLILTVSHKAVSYTHLDVYKRQSLAL